jgi:hypothetical protein
MATLLSVASFLAERAGKKTDITFIDAMKDLAVIKRARFLANTLSKDPGKARFYLQKFRVKMRKIDITDECTPEDEVDACCGERAFRTVEQVPVPLQFGVHPFEYVGPVGGFKGYNWTTIGNEHFLKHRKLVGSNARYAYTSNHIYLFNREDAELQVEGVFPDPRLLVKFQKCGENKPCWDEEQDAFLEEQIAELIVKDILVTELRIAQPNEPIQLKEDKNV